MNEMVLDQVLPPAPPAAMALVRKIAERVAAREADLDAAERFEPRMHHVLHAGMYARTCFLGAGVVITSVLIKIPTVLIVHGGAWVLAGERWHKLEGYQCIAAAANRMQVYVTFLPTQITMIFPSDARTVEEAEAEFTDETEQLLSRRQQSQDQIQIVTGVRKCQA